ncbi:murein biosynthesis integral membrane protein MurJ [Pontibacillus salipaludis]|uniref:Probable lipid II flippase MurJ n=1 Tax=Pontibacillus salipaludis TaxID=1697394 RepID=A0ABQ1QIA8_9BACI|nr:murein biosynthesis integral membrane protein MurJ [Pontibacillus salipaludis]GGD28487.1 putative lipid II flippase MurJ [Pontibacillus salipaludis]
MNQANFLKSVGIVTLVTIIGKLLGFGRETFMAAYFGTSFEADAYYVASVIPNILFAAIGMAITTGMIPLYLESKKNDEQLAKEQVGSITALFTIFTVVITAICLIFTRELISLIAPGFTDDARYIDLSVKLTRIMLPVTIFLVLTSVAKGILNANKKFLSPAAVPVANNLVIIISIILLTKEYGIYGVTIGTLIGGIAQFVVQLPSLKNHPIKFNFQFKKHKEYIVNTFAMFFPVIVAGITFQFMEIFNRMIASGLEEGSISALNYSMKLMYLPLSILLMSLITVFYPNLVEAAQENTARFLNLFWKGFISIAVVTIPVMVVMVVGAYPLIELIFERGIFNSDDTAMTSHSFFYYSIGLIFIALREYLVRNFLVLKKSKVVMYTSIIAVILNVIISYTLSQYMGHAGVALGTSISFALQLIILTTVLYKHFGPEELDHKKYGLDIIKLISLFGILFVVGEILFNTLLVQWSTSLGQLIVLTSVVFALFFGLAYLLRISELTALINQLKAKVIKQK